MSNRIVYSFLLGFAVLFILYHFPELYPVFWVMGVFKIGLIIAAFLIGRLQGWKGLDGFGLGLTKNWWSYLLFGIFVGLAGFGASFLVSILSGYERITSYPTFPALTKQLPVILLITAIPTVAEDILTRGYLYGHLKSLLSKNYFVTLSAGVYVLNHIWRLNEGIAVLTYLFLLGLLLALALWNTRSLWLAFGIHWGANIAFESTHSLFKSQSIVSHAGSTWILATTWGIVFLAFVIFQSSKNTV